MRIAYNIAIHHSALVARAQEDLRISHIAWQEPPFDAVSGCLGFWGVTLGPSVEGMLIVLKHQRMAFGWGTQTEDFQTSPGRNENHLRFSILTRRSRFWLAYPNNSPSLPPPPVRQFSVQVVPPEVPSG